MTNTDIINTLDLPGVPLTTEHGNYLIGEGLPREYLAQAVLIRSSRATMDLPAGFRESFKNLDPRGILFGWRFTGVNGDERVEWQFRPDHPPLDEVGKPKKYLFTTGTGIRYSLIAKGTGPRLWLVEGTKQGHVLASAAPDTDTVAAIPGCNGWSRDGQAPPGLVKLAQNKQVIVVLDADAATNLMVYNAGMKLRDVLSNAATLRFGQIPGGGKTGVDDYLAGMDPSERGDAMKTLAANALPRPARTKPNAKLRLVEPGETQFDGLDGSGDGDAQSEDRDWMFTLTGKIRPLTIAQHVIEKHPVALGGGGKNLAIYENGWYHSDENALTAVIGPDLLQDEYNTGHQSNIEKLLRGLCKRRGLALPARAKEPLLNTKNCMLDLRTDEELAHDPKYFSTRQLAVEWNPDATCPTYLAWLEDRVGKAQVPVVEEAISQFLDESRSPRKALFCFGPSRSGKSTMFRIAMAMLGGSEDDLGELVSAVTLQLLAEDRFASAELYRKALNIAADLPKKHVKDLSTFKTLSGDDPVQANKKSGPQFTFFNTALFLFSANTPPTVSEESNAYTNRIVPVAFPKTYEGREDPKVEQAIMRELPGILVRWVRAYQAHMARGYKFHAVPAIVQERFTAASDRVSRFLAACCETEFTTVPSGRPMVEMMQGRAETWPVDAPANATQLTAAFTAWASEENGHEIGRNTLAERLRSIPGVKEFRHERLGGVFNVRIKPRSEWAESLGGTEELIDELFADGSDGSLQPLPAGFKFFQTTSPFGQAS